MNATLQCLYHSKDLTDFLTTINQHFYNPNSVATEYLKFLTLYQNALKTNTTVISAINWCQKIWNLEEKQAKRFPKYATGDANEFLAITLGHLGLDTSKSDISPQQLAQSAKMPFPFHQLPRNSFTEALSFIIQSYSTQKLVGLKNEIPLTLEIATSFDEEGKAISFVENLEEAIAHYFKGDPSKNYKIFTYPKYLPIRMLRFTPSYSTGATIKIFNNIPFPLELNLTNYVNETAPQQNGIYELYGIVMHYGNAAHYSA